MSINDKPQPLTAQINSQFVTQTSSDPIKTNSTDTVSSLIVFAVLVVIVLVIANLHSRLAKAFEFIVSIPLYKRCAVFLIGVSATYISSKVDSAYLYIPIILGYIITFAFNEFAVKKDIEKATTPLEVSIGEKEREIEIFRRIIEEKKNTFKNVIFKRINECLRVKGKDDSDLLRKIKAKVEELQDIVLAENTFMETPDEALRRYGNSTTGDAALASQTMIVDQNIVTTAAN